MNTAVVSLVGGVGISVVGGVCGWLTARATTRSQLRGTTMTVEEDRQHRLDDKVEFVMGELRKEITRLEGKIAGLQAENDAQANRIDQQDTAIIVMRRELTRHGIPIPALGQGPTP